MATENKGEQGGGISRQPAQRTGGIRRSERKSPFSFLSRMFDDMDRVFETSGMQRNELFADYGLMQGSRFDQGWSPQIDVFERDGKFVIRADLPGLTKDDVKIELSDETITLQGERRYEHEEKKGLYRSERGYGSFFRTIPLPEGVNGEDVTASFNNGVLEISMKAPQKETAKKRRIDIQDGAKGSKSVH